MDSDVPPASPLEAPPGSPFRPEPEQPRLGIIHLLGWTACVAVHFSVIQAIRRPGYAPALSSLVLLVGVGIGRATALSGLVLLAARRYRRLPFPRQPGETLLVLLGIGAALHHVETLLYIGRAQIALSVVRTLGILLLAVLFLLAAARTSIPRWRAYFVTVLVAGAIRALLPLLLFRLLSPVNNSLRTWFPLLSRLPWFLPGAVLLFVALKDARQRPRYEWTHWLGIGVALWNGLMGVMSSVRATWLLLS